MTGAKIATYARASEVGAAISSFLTYDHLTLGSRTEIETESVPSTCVQVSTSAKPSCFNALVRKELQLRPLPGPLSLPLSAPAPVPAPAPALMAQVFSGSTKS